jgi:tetratricopeptide (TPR) repeat protein
VYYHRGVLHKELGQREEAIADLERALDLGLSPDLKQVAEKELEELRRE